MHLKYTASATWREGETRAAIGWCSQWVECNQVTQGSDLRCYWLMRAVGGVSSARLGSCDFSPVSPFERVAGGELRTGWVMMRRSDWFSAAPRHTDEGRERHTTVPWEETLTAVFLPRNRTTAVLDGFHGECIPLDVNIIIILQKLIYFDVELMHYAR